MINPFIPRPQQVFLDRNGLVTPVWRDYLNSLTPQAASNEIQAQIENLQAQIDAINNEQSNPGNVFGRYSVKQYGTLADGTVYLQLDGDVPTPGIRKVYGTNASGIRGWVDFPEPEPAVLPLVTGEIASGQPVFAYADDGSLIYTEIN
ncbi:FlxA-like family protein [Luteimonas sp. RIT-PG2_3]